ETFALLPVIDDLQTLYCASTWSPFWKDVSVVAFPLAVVTWVFVPLLSVRDVVVLFWKSSFAKWLPPVTLIPSDESVPAPVVVPFTISITCGMQAGLFPFVVLDVVVVVIVVIAATEVVVPVDVETDVLVLPVVVCPLPLLLGAGAAKAT